MRNIIDTVTIRKERIVEATNEIVEKLGELENLATRKEAMVHIRKLVNQIISDLSIIGGFWSKQDKEIIQIRSRIVKHILALESGILLKDWCIEVNRTEVDFTKKPFKMISGELSGNLCDLEAKVKGRLER